SRHLSSSSVDYPVSDKRIIRSGFAGFQLIVYIRLDCFRLDMLAPHRCYMKTYVMPKLATTSSCRKQIFEKQLGIRFFEMVNPYFNKDPTRLEVLTPEEYVKENSREKALSVARDCDWTTKEDYLLLPSPYCCFSCLSVAAVAEWYGYQIVACLVTSSSPVPLKTRHVGQRCTLNLSKAETSSRWCGVVVRRGGVSSGVVHAT
ncbi:uncharacterized protein TNCV_2659351, partial [Trichonephila clavipes]